MPENVIVNPWEEIQLKLRGLPKPKKSLEMRDTYEDLVTYITGKSIAGLFFRDLLSDFIERPNFTFRDLFEWLLKKPFTLWAGNGELAGRYLQYLVNLLFGVDKPWKHLPRVYGFSENDPDNDQLRPYRIFFLECIPRMLSYLLLVNTFLDYGYGCNMTEISSLWLRALKETNLGAESAERRKELYLSSINILAMIEEKLPSHAEASRKLINFLGSRMAEERLMLASYPPFVRQEQMQELLQIMRNLPPDCKESFARGVTSFVAKDGHARLVEFLAHGILPKTVMVIPAG